jgi:hypothetical protein
MNVLHDHQQVLLLCHNGKWTEWDELALSTLFEQMGFAFLYCDDRNALDTSAVARRFPDGKRTHDVLIIHKSRLERFVPLYLSACQEFQQRTESRQIW